MPAASTSMPSVQVSDFEVICLLIRHGSLLCGFCLSSRRFAFGYLRTISHEYRPIRSANSSPCRVCRGLSPPSGCALPGAQIKNRIPEGYGLFFPLPTPALPGSGSRGRQLVLSGLLSLPQGQVQYRPEFKEMSTSRIAGYSI